MEEHWKWIVVDSEVTNYEISDQGRVRGTKGIRKLAPGASGHICIALYGAFGRKSFMVHKLVVETFVGPAPAPDMVVHHIDGDPQNNVLTNLVWATQAENNLAAKRRTYVSGRAVFQCVKGTDIVIKRWDRIKDVVTAIPTIHRNGITMACRGDIPSTGGFSWRYAEEDLPGEKWKEITVNEKLVRVSTLGRVRQDRGNAFYGHSKPGSYKYVNINHRSFMVHRLVLLTFKPTEHPENFVVNHIDEDKANNCLENLEWTTHAENIKHSFPSRKRTAKIIELRRISSTGEVTVFREGLKKAAKQQGISSATIWQALTGRREFAGGFRWEKGNEIEILLS